MNARYRINAGYQIQEIAGEKILIAGQHSEMNFSKMLILNDSAASVIQELIRQESSIVELTKILMMNYHVDNLTAQTDIKYLLNELNKQNILEEIH